MRRRTILGNVAARARDCGLTGRTRCPQGSGFSESFAPFRVSNSNWKWHEIDTNSARAVASLLKSAHRSGAMNDSARCSRSVATLAQNVPETVQPKMGMKMARNRHGSGTRPKNPLGRGRRFECAWPFIVFNKAAGATAFEILGNEFPVSRNRETSFSSRKTQK